MKQIYSTLLTITVAIAAAAQPTRPAAPLANCNASSCITNSQIDVCPPTNNSVVTSHRNGVYNRGNATNNLGAGAVWRFRNIATVAGITINGEIKVEGISNATLVSLDDDNAVDQTGVSIASFFAPRISSDVDLNGVDRRGYVEFTMTFYRSVTGNNNGTNADFANPISLANLNFVHYDIDGWSAGDVNVGNNGSWFRETGLAKIQGSNTPTVIANIPSELTAYSYWHNSMEWTGWAGTTCERDGISRCAQTAAAFSYAGVHSSLTFRMGYDYNAGGPIGRPVRQYGSRLGCFNFPSQSTLPVKLNSFTGAYKNGSTFLKWSADNEINFDSYEIERSKDGKNFVTIGSRKSAFNGSTTHYDYTDDLGSVDGTVFYYRLKMVDVDAKYEYSSVLMFRKESKAIEGITISPNPVVNGSSNVRFSSARAGSVEYRVVDLSGKVILQRMQKIYEGTNSIALDQLSRLQAGMYILQLINDGEVSVTKFTISK